VSKQVSQPRPLLLGALPERTGSRIREALPGTLRGLSKNGFWQPLGCQLRQTM